MVRKVTVENIEMTFTSMVVFMVKWSLSTIPAMIILFAFWFFVYAMAATIAPDTIPWIGKYINLKP